METLQLQRKWDMTAGEVEGMRAKHAGLFTSQAGLWVPGKYRAVHEHTSLIVSHRNIVTNEGLDSVLDVYINAVAAITTWFLSGFVDNRTPLAGDTAGTPGFDEIDAADVDEAVRETYNPNSASSQSIDNVGTVQQYTGDQSFTFFGAILIGGGTSAFQNAAGTLWSAVLLSPAISMVVDSTIDLTYTFTAADA